MRPIDVEKLKKQGKKSLTVLPFICTFANAFFGMLSVINTLEGDFEFAALCILLAAAMDMFDGRLARALNATSVLGMELDSLCDAISFCLAPTILLYNWVLADKGAFGLFVLGFYLCAGLFRLAKFNTRADAQCSYFVGLPTTAAALFLASVVLDAPWIAQTPLAWLVSVNGITFLLACVGLLMISPLHFFALKKIPVIPRWVMGLLVLSFFISVRAFLIGMPILFITFFAYVLLSFVYGCFKLIHMS